MRNWNAVMCESVSQLVYRKINVGADLRGSIILVEQSEPGIQVLKSQQ